LYQQAGFSQPEIFPEFVSSNERPGPAAATPRFVSKSEKRIKYFIPEEYLGAILNGKLPFDSDFSYLVSKKLDSFYLIETRSLI